MTLFDYMDKHPVVTVIITILLLQSLEYAFAAVCIAIIRRKKK